MSPRGSSSNPAATNPRNASAPYSRRPTGQPKSSRQQFSACGACRMRRVRCDLKDLPFTTVGPHPACSNCKERGLKCVDEFAEVKAVKLLRRGRRLQQVEAIYGKVVGIDGSSSSSLPETRLPSIIPQLAPEFFTSPFWKWLTIQRPVLDPVEFPARYMAHTKGTHSLGQEGGLLAMVLVVWAASFGLDERGVAVGEDGNLADNPLTSDLEVTQTSASGRSIRRGSINLASDTKGKEPALQRKRKERKDKTESMLREVLELIDFHGVMRRPSWDGVRVLLLILPLMEDAHPLERLTMYEATLSQTQALCTFPGPSSSISQYPDTSDDALLRARIFWYAHMQEGISTGMRGGRLVLNNDDFEAFQNTLPPFGFGVNSAGMSCPPSPSGSLRPLSSHGPLHTQHTRSLRGSPDQHTLHTSQLFSIPLQLSAVCRKVHAVLTGSKASRRAEEHGLIDAHGMREVWDDLDQCWKDFDNLRRANSGSRDSLDIEQFVSAWQIFIFECHNMIREALKQSMSATNNMFSTSSSRPSSHSSSSPYLSPQHLHSIANRKCLTLLPLVLRIIKFHLSQDDASGGLFKYDAGLVRDGCFFAGYLAASVEGDTIDFTTDDHDEEFSRSRNRLGTEEGVALCLTALAEMRWALSKSEEREDTVRMIWENRKIGRNSGRYALNGPSRLGPGDSYADHQLPITYSKSLPLPTHSTSNAYASMSGSHERPLLPPLNLLRSPRRAESAPSTAYSTNGHAADGWPSYTPPGTGTSVTTSAGTGISARGSPVFAGLAGPMTFKGDPHETFYHVSTDMDQFSFNAPVGPVINDTGITPVSYHHRDPPASAHSLHSVSPPTYLDPGVFAAPGPSMVHSHDGQSCPQFGDNCNGFYH